MPTIQVVLNPVQRPINPGTRPRIVGLNVDLVYRGAGTTKATASPQPAELNFYEAAGEGDAHTAHSLIATLNGTLRLDGNQPVFEADNHMLAYRQSVRTAPVKSGPSWFPPAESTDWFLSLAWNGTRFENVDHLSGENRRLFLPWVPAAEENDTFEVAAELTINGQTEFWFSANNVVRVSMIHDNVRTRETTTQNGPVSRFVGVGMVHPEVNVVFHDHPNAHPGQITSPRDAGGRRVIQVNLHQSMNGIVNARAQVEGGIVYCFSGMNVFPVFHWDQTDGQATTAGFVRRADPNDPGGTSWMAATANGTTLPFFTYWVFYETGVTAFASGVSEGISNVQPSGAASSKQVVYPIRLLGQGGQGIAHDRQALATPAEQDLHVANVLAHEIGHSLGFAHVLEARPGAGYQIQPGNPDFTRATMAWENLGAFTFTRGRRFGPVHRACLDRDYA